MLGVALSLPETHAGYVSQTLNPNRSAAKTDIKARDKYWDITQERLLPILQITAHRRKNTKSSSTKQSGNPLSILNGAFRRSCKNKEDIGSHLNCGCARVCLFSRRQQFLAALHAFRFFQGSPFITLHQTQNQEYMQLRLSPRTNNGPRVAKDPAPKKNVFINNDSHT